MYSLVMVFVPYMCMNKTHVQNFIDFVVVNWHARFNFFYLRKKKDKIQTHNNSREMWWGKEKKVVAKVASGITSIGTLKST